MGRKRGELYVRSVTTMPAGKAPTIYGLPATCPTCRESFIFTTDGNGCLLQACVCVGWQLVPVRVAPPDPKDPPPPEDPDAE